MGGVDTLSDRVRKRSGWGNDGCLAATVYTSQSGGIIDVLEDMKEKAESQLAELRKAEESSQRNYAMLKQSLEAQIAFDEKGHDRGKSKQGRVS